MQEMNMNTINFYFKKIFKEASKRRWFFFNLNRYQKTVGKEIIKFENFPYDQSWETSFSENSKFQPHSHILITVRKKGKGSLKIKDEIISPEKNLDTNKGNDSEIDKENKIVNNNLLQL